MKEIKYYDRINHKVITLRVKNEVADFIKKSNIDLRNQNKQWKKHTISLDQIMQKAENSLHGNTPFEEITNEDNYFYEEVKMSVLDYQKERIPELFSDLPERNRKILILKFKKNLTNVEIAKKLGITEGSVRYIIKKSLRILSEKL